MVDALWIIAPAALALASGLMVVAYARAFWPNRRDPIAANQMWMPAVLFISSLSIVAFRSTNQDVLDVLMRIAVDLVLAVVIGVRAWQVRQVQHDWEDR